MNNTFSNWHGRTSYKLAHVALLMVGKNPDHWPSIEKLLQDNHADFLNMFDYLLVEIVNAKEEHVYNSDDDTWHDIYSLSTKVHHTPYSLAKLTKIEKAEIIIEDWAIKRWLKEQHRAEVKFFDYKFLYGHEPLHKETKEPKRHKIILEVIDRFGFDRMCIPQNGKAKISEECKEHPYNITASCFKKAWRTGQSLGLFRTEHYDKYANIKVVQK